MRAVRTDVSIPKRPIVRLGYAAHLAMRFHL